MVNSSGTVQKSPIMWFVNTDRHILFVCITLCPKTCNFWDFHLFFLIIVQPCFKPLYLTRSCFYHSIVSSNHSFSFCLAADTLTYLHVYFFIYCVYAEVSNASERQHSSAFCTVFCVGNFFKSKTNTSLHSLRTHLIAMFTADSLSPQCAPVDLNLR